MVTVVVAACASLSAPAFAEDTSIATATTPTPLTASPVPAADSSGSTNPPGRKTIEHDGQIFELANSSCGKNVETDEYTVAGEKLGEWTQLLTVQRLTVASPTSSDAFVAYFKQRVGEDGATLEVLSLGKSATVFAVRFPRSDRNEEQVMICLAFVDAANPALLNIVQYAIKPMRSAVPVVEMRIRSWRDQFLRQTQALSPP